MTQVKRFKPAYDAIVVGAGMAGLAAAGKLAKAGKKTLLLEQHNMTGGFATSFVRGRYEFELSLHEACEMSDGKLGEYGAARRMLDDIGAKVDFRLVPDAYRVMLSDLGVDFTMPWGVEEAIAAIEKLEPGNGKKVRNYFQLFKEVNDALEYIGSCGAAGPEPKVMATKYSSFLRCAAYNVDEVQKSFKFGPKTENVLNAYYGYIGRGLSRSSFIIWAQMIYIYLRDGGYAVYKTSHALANAMEYAFRANGGQVELNVKVTEFLMKDGRCVGVKTDSGEEIAAEFVLFNGAPNTALVSMFPEGSVPEEALKLASARKLLASPFMLYIGLDALPQEMGIDSYEYFISNDMNTDRIWVDTNEWAPHVKLSATCLDVAMPGITGPDRCQINFTTLYNPDAMNDASINKYDYLPEKERFANQMIDFFEERTGAKIRDHIEEIEIATPATFNRYTGALRGNIYGYECDAIDGVVPRALRAEAERYIPGFDFIGSAGFRAHGYSSVITNGYQAAEIALRKMGGNGNG